MVYKSTIDGLIFIEENVIIVAMNRVPIFLLLTILTVFVYTEEIIIGFDSDFTISVEGDGGLINFRRVSRNPYAGEIEFDKRANAWVGLVFTAPEIIELNDNSLIRVNFSRELETIWTFTLQDKNLQNPMHFELVIGLKDFEIPFDKFSALRGEKYKLINQIILAPPWNLQTGNCFLTEISIINHP